MGIRLGINGFSRIRRLVFQALCDQGLLGKEFDGVDVSDVVTNADYFRVPDEVRRGPRPFPACRRHGEEQSLRGRQRCPRSRWRHEVRCIMAAKDPSELPWKTLAADYVLESRGLFTGATKARGHLAAGATKVILSAPGKGDV